MKEIKDWKTRLANFIVAAQKEEFKWGKFDCCIFVCYAIREMTGTNPHKQFKNKYTSMKSAYRLLKEFSGETDKDKALEKTVELVCGTLLYKEKPIAFRQTGDICIVRTDAGLSLAICFNGCAVVVSDKGVITLPGTFIQRVWNVANKKDEL